MQCYNHPEVGAVLVCHSCPKSLCRECADRYTPPMCHSCALQHDEEVLGSARANLAAIKWQQTTGMLKIIWAIICMATGLGLLIYYKFESSRMGFINIIDASVIACCFGAGGVPWFLGGFGQNSDSQELTELKKITRSLPGNEGAVLGGCLGRLLVGVVVILFSVIVTPALVGWGFYRRRQLKKRTYELEEFITVNSQRLAKERSASK